MSPNPVLAYYSNEQLFKYTRPLSANQGYCALTIGLGGTLSGDSVTELDSSKFLNNIFYLWNSTQMKSVFENAPKTIFYRNDGQNYTLGNYETKSISWNNDAAAGKKITGGNKENASFVGVLEFDLEKNNRFERVKNRVAFNNAFSKLKEDGGLDSKLNEEAVVFGLCSMYGNVYVGDDGKIYRQPTDDEMNNDSTGIKQWEEVTDKNELKLFDKALEYLKINKNSTPIEEDTTESSSSGS